MFVVLIVWTDADADGAIAVLGDPIAEAFLPIDHPFTHADDIRLVVDFC